MATKADFTADEWKHLHQGVSGAGMLVSLADQDLSDSFGEANVLAKYLAGEHLSGSTELVREICGGHSTGFGVFSSPTKVRDETMAALAGSVAALRAKAPDELAPYRALVLGAAEAVAEAKGGVKAPEQAMIDAIAKAIDEA